MKKLLILVAILFGGAAHAGPMANVEYVHKVIEQHWGINVPYNPALENPKIAANMKYLLTAIDVTNTILNGEATTDYGNSEYATQAAADTFATDEAAQRLIKIEPKFFVTTTADTAAFSFKMSAKGTFAVDWGDGNIEKIVRTNTTETTYSHTYTTAGEYKIGIGGKATEYSTSASIAAISFNKGYEVNNPDIAKIEGSLGAIFATIGDGSANGQQPRFNSTFFECRELTGNIPDNIFTGVFGTPISSMFSSTFRNTGLTGSIPENLFAGIFGAPAYAMFDATFYGCHTLSGSIPEKLFAGISGAPAQSMFSYAFHGCNGLTGPIPEKLFSGISGAPQHRMFNNTFAGCSGLTGQIPEKLFEGISGAPATIMFQNTFSGCSRLTGSIPKKLFAGISGTPAQGMFDNTFYNCKGLTSIPEGLFAGISGAPAASMFSGTFSSCSGLTGPIPENLFLGISGAPAQYMFNTTFYNCSGLTSIPENLFGDISGATQSYMFRNMFSGCKNLSGPSARINGTPLYEIWPSATSTQVGECYHNATGLSDYEEIPAGWK